MTSFSPDAWQNAQPGEYESNDPPPPGLYDVTVTNARAFTSSNGNDVMIVSFQVISGDLRGHQWDDIRGFKTEGAIKAAKGMASSLGVDVDSIAALEDLNTMLQGAVGNYYEAEIKRNGNFTNTYVNRQVVPGDPGTSDIPSDPDDFTHPEPTTAGADPIPF